MAGRICEVVTSLLLLITWVNAQSEEYFTCPSPNDIRRCQDTCRSDIECPRGHRCCYSQQCGYTCYSPLNNVNTVAVRTEVEIVSCPAFHYPREYRCDYPCHADSDCQDGGRCCNFPCGQSCWWAPSESFSTATVRGKCTYQETAAEGDRDLRLSCELRANNTSPMNIQWYKDKSPMPNGGRERVHSMEECQDTRCRSLETHLMFDRVQMEDEGKYMMVVSAGQEQYGHAVQLRIYNKPFIEILPEHSMVSSGQSIELTCKIMNIDRTKPYYKAGTKLKWCHRGLSNADYGGVQRDGYGQEVLRLENISGDVVIGCGLNSTECTVTAEVQVLPNSNNGCPVSIDIRRYQWPWTTPGQSRTAPCPTGYAGSATRECSIVSTWFYPNYYRCVSQRILQADRQLGRMRYGEFSAGQASAVLAQLDGAARDQNLTSGDIDKLVSSISKITIYIKVTKKIPGSESTESFINIINRALSMENRQEWEVVLQEVSKLNHSTVRELLQAVSDYGLVAADEQLSDDPVVLVKETVLFGAGTSPAEDLTFPRQDDHYTGPRSRRRRSVFDTPVVSVQKASLENITSDTGDVRWTYAVYTTLGDIVNLAGESDSSRSMDEVGRVEVISDIVSVMVASPPDTRIDPPLSAKMRMWQSLEESADDTDMWTCGRFVPIKESNLSRWSGEGCHMTLNNSDVICTCDRFGNIAVLKRVVEPSKLVMLVVRVAAILPVLGALVILFVKCRRGCCRASSVLAVNLCVAVVLCYGLVAAAVDFTRSKVVCSCVGAVLHCLFTVLVVSVLAQSVHQVLVFSRSLNPRHHSPRHHYIGLVFMAWVAGGCVAAVTVGYLSLNSYGTSYLCWITWEQGASFALLGPSVIILLLHFCFLLYCVSAGRSQDGDNGEEHMVMQTGKLKVYPETVVQHEKRKSTLLKQGFRTLYVLLEVLMEITLILMASFHFADNLLEYIFAAVALLKTIILIFVDAYLQDMESWNEGTLV